MAKTFVYLHTEKAVRKDDTAVPKINIYYASNTSQVSTFPVLVELRDAAGQRRNAIV
ncbi:MAG: hypothetical protein ACLP6G_15855 [Terriglobales bacterium]